MTSEAFVWRWHPGATQPVLCGRLYVDGGTLWFVYRRVYRGSRDALALSPHMPIQADPFMMRSADILPRPLADAGPDAWGRRVIEYRSGTSGLDELSYLVNSRSDRIGAFEFTATTEPPELKPPQASLQQLMEAAESLEQERPLDPELQDALEHGTSIGGARPKATLRDGKRFLIAKFSSTTDHWPVVRAEFAGMLLAQRCGISIPWIKLASVGGKDVLLLERFDRVLSEKGAERRQLLSALSLLDLEEFDGPRASYTRLAETLRRYGHVQDARDLFRRMVYNILIGNTDDHAKNHSAFWDGTTARLTPAYDVVPYLRVGQEARQAMIVGDEGRSSTMRNALSACESFGLTKEKAAAITEEVESIIRSDWNACFEQAGIAERFVDQYRRTSILSPVALVR